MTRFTFGDEVWMRILDCEGKTFTQKRGGVFSFRRTGETLKLSRTNQPISRSVFERAFQRVPIEMPSLLTDLRAPSYLFNALMDPKIRRDDW